MLIDDDDRIVLTTGETCLGRHDEVLREATTQHPTTPGGHADGVIQSRELLFIVELHRRGLLGLIAVDEAHVVRECGRSSLRASGTRIRSAPEARPSIVASPAPRTAALRRVARTTRGAGPSSRARASYLGGTAVGFAASRVRRVGLVVGRRRLGGCGAPDAGRRTRLRTVMRSGGKPPRCRLTR